MITLAFGGTAGGPSECTGGVVSVSAERVAAPDVLVGVLLVSNGGTGGSCLLRSGLLAFAFSPLA